MSDGYRWNGYSHEELYKQIHAGPGPKASHASMERWEGVSAALTEINAELHTGVLNSGAVWEGAAADQARAGMNPLAAWADDARTGAEVMKVSAELQADFIGKARSDMPPPVQVSAEDPGVILTGLTHLVGGQTDYEKEEKAHNAAEQKAREVMATYASSTTTNTSTLGRFHQPPQLMINVGGVSHADGPGVGATAPSFGYNGGQGGSGGRGGRGSGRGGRGAAPVRPTAPQTTPTRPSSTSTGGTTSTSSAGSTTTNSRVPTGSGTSTGLGHGGVLGGGAAGKSTDRDKKDTTHAESATARAGGSSGTTMASSAEFAPMASAQQAATAGPGGSSGTMAGGTPMGQGDTEHRRTVAKLPLPASFDPFGAMGGARADDEEDATHDSADYLRETDDIYGIGGMISPPVIGES